MSSQNALPSTETWKDLWRILPHRRVAVIVILFVGAAILDGVSVGLVLPFLSLVTGTANGADEHRVVAAVTQLFGRYGIAFTLGPLLILIGVAAFFRTVASVAAINLTSRMVERLQIRLRTDILANLFKVSISYFSTARIGDLTQCALDEVEKTGMAVTFGTKLVAGGALAAVWVALMAAFSWQLTLLSMVVAACLTALVRVRFRYSTALGAEIAAAKRRLSRLALDLLSGLRIVRLNTRESSELERLRSEASIVGDANYRFIRNTGVVNLVGENFATFAMLAIVYVSVVRIRVDSATLVAFFFVLSRLLPMLHRLNVSRTELQGYMAHVRNVLDLIGPAGKPYAREGTRPAPSLERAIEFRNVSFAYRAQDPVIRDLTLTIPKASTVAFVGGSGAGKSTLADLLVQFYEPDQGEILVDGIPLRDIDATSWRSRLGVVSQDVFLFGDTIRANIAYGAEDVGDTEIELAARLAHAHEFIKDLPAGYDTEVGDRGVTLSGGQKQRIALARAIVRRPELLILDEATSALDAESERFIIDAIDQLAGMMTIVVIGHRLASLHHADRIYVIEGGRIVEAGTHQELVAAQGRYAQYCDLQRV